MNSPQKQNIEATMNNAVTINSNEVMAELRNMKTEMKRIADFCNFVS